MNAQLELFYGAATTSEARVYARISSTESDKRFLATVESDELELKGRLVGPECKFSHTLPARFTFVDRSAPGRLLAEAIIPDPCFWTPELPFQYRARMELLLCGKSIGALDQQIGIRPLGAVGRSLKFDGKRFVIRAVRRDFGNDRTAIEQCAALARESYTAIVLPHPTDEICEFASLNGVLLIADLTDGSGIFPLSDDAPELRRLARWPAVAIAALNGKAHLPVEIHRIVPNLLLAQHFSANQKISLAAWAQLAIIDVANPTQFSDFASLCDGPVIAARRLPQPATLEASRAACDELQRDLAPHGDFAGYCV